MKNPVTARLANEPSLTTALSRGLKMHVWA